MRKPLWIEGAFLLLSVSAAYAQAPGAPAGLPPLAPGTVQSVTDSTLVVKTADGKTTTFAFPANTNVSKVSTKTIADLKSGQFVGSTSVPGTDGKRRAEEVHIIDQRGMGEGHRPMDGERTMTNGNVDTAAADGKNKTLTISYKGGTQVIEVTPATRLTAMEPAARADLKPGEQVIVLIGKDASGNPAAKSVMIGSLPPREPRPAP